MRLVTAAATALAAGALAIGCGGDGDGGESSNAKPAASTTKGRFDGAAALR